MSETLSIVATPIGNMQDISLRAAKTLLTVDVIACEDTRRAGLLLQEIAKLFVGFSETKKPKFISFYDQVEEEKIPYIISLLQQGLSVALISDAGTPLISDPGFKLVRECVKQKIHVNSIPGPSSIITALTVAGLPTDKFTFIGYPPHKSGHRLSLFEKMKKVQEQLLTTIVLFEAPHKLLRTLTDMEAVFGDIPIVICRELTKIHEEVIHKTISTTLTHFSKKQPKGEIIILFRTQDRT